ncbi:FUSC family protein [Faecalibacter rhinopitheci]|uniref:FUSC family protein n=1 Tax=Faecalibacter rhinopitheci TaxID=2779678 RepID=A0A8J7KAL7_9FLAO|nr:FUSC family protein [Faecalibacter rhinopitheci]MBF0597670.1 FUSC family protein [Faecalibacter rhinopitheci]MBQ0148441.1 FUSC family protein [Candidatus Onthonaster equi]
MVTSIVKRAINSQFLVYLLRCIIGFLIGWILILKFPQYDFFWALLSIILVISPEENQAKKLTIDRFKSNFLGSLSGLVVFFLPIDDLYKIILGIIITCIFCRIFNLLNVARSALVAVLIILIEHKNDSLFAPISRFLTTAVGCFIGLGVTLVTSIMIQEINKFYEK